MSGTMRAAVLHGPRNLAVESVPLPTAEPGQELVRVGACGLCGSDLRYFAGENPWAKHTLGYEKPNPPNMILGHEIGGFVAGPEGPQAVGVLSFRACGCCPECHRGQEQLCRDTAHLGHGAGWEGQNPGGMAEWVPVWSEHLYLLPDHVSVDDATFLDGLAVAVHAVRRAMPEPGGAVVVLGGGPIGLMIAQVAHALGAARTVVTDVYEAPLRCLQEWGLGPVLNTAGAGAQDLAEALRRLAGSAPTAVFDTTGDGATQQAGLTTLAAGGVLNLLAGVGEGFAVSTAAVAGERRVTTSSNHRYEDFGAALALLASGQVRVREMITHRFPLSHAVEAFAVAADKTTTGAVKVVLLP